MENKSKIAFLCIIILSLLSLYTTKRQFGRCSVENPKIVENFDINRYMGKWYEQIRDIQTPFQSGDCTTAEYTLIGENVKVVNSELRETGRVVAEAKGFYPNPPHAHLKINFGPDYLKYFPFLLGNYNVLETDYDSYAIVYACTDFFGLYSIEFVWVLTREVDPSDHFLNEISTKLVKIIGYPEDGLRYTKQGDDCTY